MIYVGIDIAKLNHFASAMSSDGEISLQLFKISNDYDGFHQLKSRLDSFVPDQLIKGLERRTYHSLQELQSSVLEYMEGFYNSKRPHGSLRMLTPNEKEKLFWNQV